ncbi:Aste57867_16626 [Aphanomyces stellatus]|uniref:Aste57867_16626 protein n=1 Tax=Aphanomyces stellatus TaxID=120398 RepID=A0A485L690_9STRA|nr:hypothetical protein As57867_016569 [Aphanomyces stellatus]VFT93397.1 Aste57867_16626 [Aphanomyces stellatus]
MLEERLQAIAATPPRKAAESSSLAGRNVDVVVPPSLIEHRSLDSTTSVSPMQSANDAAVIMETTTFVGVSRETLDTLDIPDAIVLTRTQIQTTSIVVLAALLLGSLLIVTTVAMARWAHRRRKTTELIAWVERQSSDDVIRTAMSKSRDMEFHAAAALRLRLLTFLKQAGLLLNEANHKEFDVANWVVVTRLAQNGAAAHMDVGVLLAQLDAALQEGRALAKTHASVVNSSLEKLEQCHHQMTELRAAVMDELATALATPERNGWSLAQWEQIADLWRAVGLDERDLNAQDNWYHATRAELDARDRCVATLVELHTAVLTAGEENSGQDEAALREMELLLLEADGRGWTHDTLHQMGQFVQSKKHDDQMRLEMVTFEREKSAVESFRASFVHQREEKIRHYIVEDQMSRSDAVKHIESMVLQYTMHLQTLTTTNQNTERTLRETREQHLATLRDKHVRERKRAADKLERDREKYRHKVAMATEAFERRQAMKAQKREEAREKEVRAERRRWLDARRVTEWRLVQWVLFLDVVVLLLIVAVVFWDTVASSTSLLSSECDVRTSYWAPSQLTIWSCQLFYGAKVAAGMVGVVLFLSMLSYLNLSLYGVGIVTAGGLYLFRASWKNMLLRAPFTGWLFLFNFAVGYLLSIDPWLTWRVYINWRPFLVYVIYPLASLTITAIVGIWVACDTPFVCIDTALVHGHQLLVSL